MTSAALQLIQKGRSVLGVNQVGLAELLGVSVRTVQRHERDGGLSWHGDHQTFLQALHPRDPALAAEIAAALGRPLADYGIQAPVEAPVATPVGPPPPSRATRAHADSVVCAAADAFGIVPRDARPIVAAILTRVQELNVELASLVPLIAEGTAAKK